MAPRRSEWIASTKSSWNMPPETNVRVSNPSLFIAVATLALIQVSCGRRNIEINPETSLSSDIAPIHLTDANFQQEVIDSEMPVLVDMWAPWCQPCLAMKPIIGELAEELKGEAKVAELNIDENLFIKEKYEVTRYPMLLIYSRGHEVKRMIGVQSKQAILEAMRTAKSSKQQDGKIADLPEDEDNRSATASE